MSFFKSAAARAEEAYTRGLREAQAEQWGRAMSHFKRAARLKPDSAVIHHALAVSLSKSAPANASEDELKAHMLQACSAFEIAMDLGESNGGLVAADYQKACASVALIYRLAGRVDDAVRSLERGLSHVPDDPELLYSLAVVLLETQRPAEAEQVAVRLLKIRRESEDARILWKSIRKSLGKGFHADLPEEKRKEIYCAYKLSSEKHLLLFSDLAAKLKETENPRADVERAVADAEEEARKQILERYQIQYFQLDLIVREGEKESWVIESPSVAETIHVAVFRDSLRCPECGKSNVAPLWPEYGDHFSFYCQSQQRTLEAPGTFRLPIQCAFCRKLWYVVWDESPDRLAAQFLHHIERILNGFSPDDAGFRVFYQLVSDQDLGRILKCLKQEIAGEAQGGETKLHRIETDDYYHLLSIFSVSSEDAASCFPNGYLAWLDPIAVEWDRENSSRHLVHWIYCYEHQAGSLNLAFLPNQTLREAIPVIYPSDLLNREEKRYLGIEW